ncbi:ferritin-like fold-containing protein [Timonella sp. A28]|uniref:ferritin-like fold-containing protein n=1 Tax=Timonella sp. A28 TaxID=3442640 RepID=UPI003EBCBB99
MSHNSDNPPLADSALTHAQHDAVREPLQNTGTAHQDDAIELLGLLAYTELSAQMRLAIDAAQSPTAEYRVAHAHLSAAAYNRMQQVVGIIDELGYDGRQHLLHFNDAYAEYEERTRSQTWHERVLKGYVGHAVALDFCRVALGTLAEDIQARVKAILDDTEESANARAILNAKSQADPVLASRLALWGRRLVGESLHQIQQLIAANPALERLVVGGAHAAEAKPSPRQDQQNPEVAWLFSQLTAQHTRRMEKIGLAA